MTSLMGAAGKSLLLCLVALSVLALGQREARADQVFIAGFTNGCFGTTVTPCTPENPASFNAGATDVFQGLTYTNTQFSGTTAGPSGFLAFGGMPQNFGTMTLSATTVFDYSAFPGTQFGLRITFTDPQGISGGGSATFSATVVGFVQNDPGGGVSLLFNDTGTVFTFADTDCTVPAGATPGTTCGSGQFTLFLDNVSINPGQTVSLTGRITGAQQSAIPEPATMLLLGTGLAGIAAKVRRRRKAISS